MIIQNYHRILNIYIYVLTEDETIGYWVSGPGYSNIDSGANQFDPRSDAIVGGSAEECRLGVQDERPSPWVNSPWFYSLSTVRSTPFTCVSYSWQESTRYKGWRTNEYSSLQYGSLQPITIIYGLTWDISDKKKRLWPKVSYIQPVNVNSTSVASSETIPPDQGKSLTWPMYEVRSL